jgi:ABC-2 type transport system permease protein
LFQNCIFVLKKAKQISNMQKILLIIQHEYLKRVKKKSFIVMTLLTPLLMASIYIIPILLAMQKDDLKKVEFIDESGLIADKLINTEEVIYSKSANSIAFAKSNFPKSNMDALVFIPKNIIEKPDGLQIFAEKNVNLSLKSSIEKIVENEVKNIRLKNAGIDIKIIEDNKVNVSANTFSLNADGQKKNSSEAAAVVGYILAFLLYGILFIYGAQVMRGVMEEKTSRIIEVMISSVKPFQLMIGKIVGVGLVGITQFVLWIALSYLISTITMGVFMKDKLTDIKSKVELAQKQIEKDKPEILQKTTENPISGILEYAKTLPISTILVTFLLYFLGGYLLYSALFAAVGAAVDSEADTQQFMLPVSLPIIIAIVLAPASMKDPDGNLAFWASMIPFTSPIHMMIRIPFGVPFWQIALSLSFLIIGFMGTTWLAARIYRVGILMYGKKTTFKEIGKWIFYKE